MLAPLLARYPPSHFLFGLVYYSNPWTLVQKDIKVRHRGILPPPFDIVGLGPFALASSITNSFPSRLSYTVTCRSIRKHFVAD